METKERTSEMYVHNDSIQLEKVGEGVQRKILGFDKNIMMVEVEFKKDGIGPIHAHPHTQVTYVAAGSFDVFIGEEKKVLKKGDCFYIPPQVSHGVVCLEDGMLIDVFTPCREDFLKD